MAAYELWYFLEGEDAYNRVTISKDEKAIRLREVIHGQFSNSYCNGIDGVQLVLLKVCHKTSSQHSD